MTTPTTERMMKVCHLLQQTGLEDVSVWLAAKCAEKIVQERPRRKRMTAVRIAGATGGLSRDWIEEGRLAEAKG